jgi:hypothetical protein
MHGVAGSAWHLSPHIRAINRARHNHRMEMALFELFEYPATVVYSTRVPDD